MTDAKLYRLIGEDVDRLDRMIEKVRVETEKLGMKKVKQSTMLRALIFNGESIKDEDLIEALKKAYICA